ncbi:translation elongation factor EF-1 subunit alpha [Candidatus Micrarchaeota archaeon CG08_land_8_20_14_0_20_59_11]|nr:MAG: translation elongation factor EF-1 subunit alpha [Candidatus Micrarchaeota archaeon CG08_land_8_20_14_0_20_59_11]
MAEKPHLNLIFTGHVDHGKSTLVGRILYETGALSENDLRKLKEEAAKVGKPTFEFAFAMDQLKEERERGVTIDIAHRDFRTQKYYFTIIDAPGHKDFVKNMITGASQADAAVLVCSAKEGVQAQTVEHAFLLKVLGVSQFIVAINKMDAVNYDRVKYEDTKQALIAKIKPMGYAVDKIPFIPTSAYEGANITKKSEKTPWYAGPTVLEAFDMLVEPKKPTDKPLRLPIQEVFTITGQGTVPVGRVEAGILKPNTTIIIMPENLTGEVKSIEMHHQSLQQAIPGDNVGFALKGVDKKAIRRGSVVGYPNNPPTVAEEFTAQIVVLNHPTAIGKNYTPVFHLHTAQLACTIVEILEKKDPKTGATAQKNPDFIKTGDVAIVRVKPTRPCVVETYSEYPALGRFAMRDMGQTVAAGVVLKVTPKKA